MGFHNIPRPPRIVALGGPVSAAIRAMRADEPATEYSRIRELRRAIADRIEADIALLDALAGDADFEQDAGDMPEQDAGDMPEFDPAEDGIGDIEGLNEQFAGTRYAIGGRYA